MERTKKQIESIELKTIGKKNRENAIKNGE